MGGMSGKEASRSKRQGGPLLGGLTRDQESPAVVRPPVCPREPPYWCEGKSGQISRHTKRANSALNGARSVCETQVHRIRGLENKLSGSPFFFYSAASYIIISKLLMKDGNCNAQ